MSVIPKIEYENDKVISIEMMPIVLGFDRKGKLNGLPYHAKGQEAKEIFDVLSRLSAPYGVSLTMENDYIKIK